MVQIVRGGQEVFSAMAFGPSHPSTLNFLRQQFNNVSDTLSASAQAFKARAEVLFEQFHGNDAIRLAKSAMRASQHMFQKNLILPLDNIASLQQAQPIMQRWIMANPVIREMYHMQRCDGYSGSYVDVSPGLRGLNHHDYLKVIDGLVLDETEGDDYVIHRYASDTEEDDVELDITDIGNILSTWQWVEALAKPGQEDPTDPDCNTL